MAINRNTGGKFTGKLDNPIGGPPPVESLHFLERLRAANVARNVEWENEASPFTTEFWANELGGEAGEACNILKKLDRERLKVVGSRATIPALAEELADVIICCDLLGMHLDLPQDVSFWLSWQKHGGEPNYSRMGAELLASVGRVAALALHPLNPRDALAIAISTVISRVGYIAAQCGIDLERMVITKFNMTSEKVGLNTRLA
jgi:NTP pyrophosphatase (non-canonical NTP hydrolase)